jgi:DNA-binding NtrC family response regulator
MTQGRILVIDDEAVALRNLVHVLRKEGYEVTGAQSGEAGMKALARGDFDLVITDLRMDRIDGFAILAHCREHLPDAKVIVITGYATVSSAVDAMREGAFHYVAKPFRIDEVRHVVREALELVRLTRENRTLRDMVAEGGAGVPVTQDAGMEKLLDTARQAAAAGCSVIITGESGTGKELIARFLHRHSARSSALFVGVNCGAFSEELLANELFGHEKGAFTGANETRPGLIEAASGGTLFLDEVTEMSPAMQVKLLRVIQEQEVRRLGGAQDIGVDVRFIAATNRNLPEAMASGSFRQDLYYRLNVMQLRLPPLSERTGDIPLLAQHFLRKAAARLDRRIDGIAPEAMALLNGYSYPGNVRELANIIERGVALCDRGTLNVEHLPDDLRELQIRSYRWHSGKLPTLETQEADYIRWVMAKTDGNRTQAAGILGIDRVSLWRKIKKYGIDT